MSDRKLKCYECERRRPEDETILISARIGGDYRRAARRGHVRVCRECAQEHLDYTLREQEKGLVTALNTGRMQWEQALRFFGIEIPSGTLLDRMTGKRA